MRAKKKKRCIKRAGEGRGRRWVEMVMVVVVTLGRFKSHLKLFQASLKINLV